MGDTGHKHQHGLYSILDSIQCHKKNPTWRGERSSAGGAAVSNEVLREGPTEKVLSELRSKELTSRAETTLLRRAAYTRCCRLPLSTPDVSRKACL
jgi:hypothetical protein